MVAVAEQKVSHSGSKRWIVTLVICVGLIVAAVVVVWLIQTTEPTAQKVTASKRGAMLVDVVTAEKGTFRPLIAVMGQVQAKDQIQLSARVSGEVIECSPSFEPGSIIEKGELLVKVDPSDYDNEVAQKKSILHQMQAELALEMGQQRVVRNEYELVDGKILEEDATLILRQPQLETAKANVESAEVAVKQAETELSRTVIRAPFKAMVMERNVSAGSQVSTGVSLGRLVGVDAYWVTASVPLDKLTAIEIPGQGSDQGSSVKVRNRTAWKQDAFRDGVVFSVVGELDASSRMARLNILVEDPLSLQAAEGSVPSLILGSLLEVIIEGKPLEGVVRLSREYVRNDNTVWVMEDDKLRISPVSISFFDSQYAYIDQGLENGASVVTTGLSSVVNGAELRTEEESSEVVVE